MNKTILSLLLTSSSLAFTQTLTDKEELDNIEVIGHENNQQNIVKLLPENAQSIIDTPEVLKKIPGANVNRNGPLSGIAQYRGLFGNRVNVQIDNITMQESCSNSMDTAMSHIPASMVDAVVLKRGISPVSSAIESIGGSISVIAKENINQSEAFQLHGDVSSGFSTVNSGKKTSVLLSGTSEFHNIYLGFDSESGDSFKFPNGKNYSTEYNRDFYMFGYNFKSDNQELKLKLNYNDTGNTGTPSLPMDIVYAEGGVISLEHALRVNDSLSLNSQFSHQNTDHLMNNYLFRSTTDKKDSLTQVNNNSYSLTANSNQAFGNLTFGLEGDFTAHQATITNPDNPMFSITNFDTRKYRHSAFAELEKKLSEKIQMTTGLRYTFVDMSAADVYSSVSMMQNSMGNLHRALQDRFNNLDRNINDNNLDLAITFEQKINDDLSLEYGFARKTRSPSYQERYLWLPLEATAGMADGLQYFGNLNLKPEKANQLELGLNFSNDKLSFSPHVFYHDISDYIHGTPTTSSPTPPNTLTFNNVDAELYGADMEFSYKFNSSLTLNNVTSYVRGKRKDIDDNLYRIAPLNTRIELVYANSNWSLSSEIVAYQSQENISSTNKEKTTPGYGLLNLASNIKLTDSANIAFGMNNVFNKQYYNHLNGYNRNNLNTDVGFDASNLQAYRLPGEGRNIYFNLYLHW